MFPNAMNFIHCSGNSAGAWLTIIECAIVVIQYALISWYWTRFDNRIIARTLQAIFILCATCGYMTVILSCDDHTVNFAYTVRAWVFLPLLIAVNSIFLIFARKKTFQAYDKEFLSAFHKTTDEVEDQTDFPKRVIIDAILLQVRDSQQVIENLQDDVDKTYQEITDNEITME